MGIGCFLGRLYLHGPAYADSALLLPWLLLLFVLPNGILTQGVVARTLWLYYAFAAGFSAVLNIGLNLVLVPEFGGEGGGLGYGCYGGVFDGCDGHWA